MESERALPPLSHDGLVDVVIELTARVRPRAVGDAFLASLSRRDLGLRSALGSYAVARHFPQHRLADHGGLVPSGGRMCGVCGHVDFEPPWAEPTDDLTWERETWGGCGAVRRRPGPGIW